MSRMFRRVRNVLRLLPGQQSPAYVVVYLFNGTEARHLTVFTASNGFPDSGRKLCRDRCEPVIIQAAD